MIFCIWTKDRLHPGIHSLRQRREFPVTSASRFGKLLLVSRLKVIFQRRRELFHGLATEQQENDWQESPIIHLDFSNVELGNPQSLHDFLKDTLEKWAKKVKSNCGDETFQDNLKTSSTTSQTRRIRKSFCCLTNTTS
ncbi:MAG: AAA family ATPase [Victivallales bacterium]|nr:AAA family ATPase [Victivallales bacterium]